MINKTEISKDLANRKLLVIREFAAPVDKIWKAWTESEVLDKWWAPKPWKANTKSMDFKEGGTWLYCMAGPNGEQSWSRVDFKTIEPQNSFSAVATFSDDNGVIIESFPEMRWYNVFQSTATGSKVIAEISFDKEADMAKIIEMGFEGGFTMALGNLDELL
jgi:uncharacterized protein YndB with AHSA1/START domain